MNDELRQGRTGSRRRYGLRTRQVSRIQPRQDMAALIAIGVFIVAIFLLNLLDFGRLD
ncbi:MAG TPA: hypothetical protein VEA80_11965 [Vitreimonas sp.]|nr:hypothetical protein [Vitreimonas sp.]